ncbi:MDIS1-interacting receptor like kinase 2-like [Salvia splendens]|uniref:MDIS1-interacting receptor like kinase 2-like n=1 Tax=Salvia splendens TaxID=180675 RepID=UPI001C268F2C|nr:MDIS1-interacting receptor like kinase 2-like [Salvia splendens]
MAAVAVKKLHEFEGDNPAFDSSFRNEAKLLSQIRHRHVVKLSGVCMHQQSMFLIYDYMERGSLFSVLTDEDEAVKLNWKKRLAFTMEVTEKCDVYRYRVLALEVMFGQFGDHPEDFISFMTIMKRSTQFTQKMMVQQLLDKRMCLEL